LPIPATGQSAPVFSWTYDANGNKLTSTDPLGRVTSYTWDKMSRLTKETLPVQVSGGQNPTIIFAYDNLSRKTSETNAEEVGLFMAGLFEGKPAAAAEPDSLLKH